jgi:hypothetical protein
MTGARRVAWIFAQATMVLAALVVSATGAIGAVAFKCSIPDGWIDLSPGAPAHNFDAVSEQTRTAARAQDWLAFAVSPDEGARISLMLESESLSGPIDDAYVDLLTIQLTKGGALVSVHRKELLVVAGLSWARIEGSTPDGTRSIAYVIPGNPRNGFLLFASTPDMFDQLAPKFDALARETRGAATPPARRNGPLLSTLVGGTILLLVSLWIGSRRRRTPKPPPPT